jgi:NADH dehydrogenase
VIVGGGAGGIELASSLGDALGKGTDAQVLLIDPAFTHVWKPHLHELAAGTMRLPQASVDFLPQARRHHFRFHLGSMEGLDRQRKQVHLQALLDDDGVEIAPSRKVPYDTLVLCVGSVVNDFGTPGVREHGVLLDGAPQALRLHRRLLAACARAEAQDDGPVRVVVVGGGATGVELAAELNDAVGEIASYGLRLGKLERPAHVTLVEAGPRLLVPLPEETAAKAQAELQARGVDVLVDTEVAEVRAGHVRLAGERKLASDITVWCAGTQGPEVLTRLDGLEPTRSRQVPVRPTLQAVGDDAIYAFGDCASVQTKAGTPEVPPRAQAAHQQAQYLARALPRRLRGEAVEDFEFSDRGALVSLGRSEAVGSLVNRLGGGRIALHGLVALWSYRALQRQHMARLHGTWRMLLATLSAWLEKRSHSPVKLH